MNKFHPLNGTRHLYVVQKKVTEDSSVNEISLNQINVIKNCLIFLQCSKYFFVNKTKVFVEN
jgi:hypothetical protein